jgi:hypothetical protein
MWKEYFFKRKKAKKIGNLTKTPKHCTLKVALIVSAERHFLKKYLKH